MTRSSRHTTLRRIAPLFCLSILAGLNTGASCLGGLPDAATNAVTDATLSIDNAVSQIQASSSSWQTALTQLEANLSKDAQTTLSNEVGTLIQGSIGVANAGIFCTVDFIGVRVIQALGRLKAELLGQAAPSDLSPATCEVAPAAIDFALYQENRIGTVNLYGYDLDAPMALKLVTGAVTTDVTADITRPSHYQITINLGSNGVKLTAQSQRLDLVATADPTHPVSSIAVVQPVTPVCEVKTLPPVALAKISFQPPKVGNGDNDFAGHGPAIRATEDLSISAGVVHSSLFMDAKETQGDWTEVEGTRTGIVYSPDPGWSVTTIAGPLHSEYSYTDSNHTDDVFSPGSGPVDNFDFVGDTGDDDVGRTGVTVTFKPLSVTVTQVGNCVTQTAAQMLIKQNLLKPETLERLKPLLGP